MTPTEKVTNDLRAPLEPAHGIWELWRRSLNGLAHLIEQNTEQLAKADRIIQELHQLNGPAEKK